MIRNITVGIDVGSSTTRVVVAEFLKGEKNPKIIGAGESESKGMRHGYVVDSATLKKSIRSAIAMAERSSGIKIKRAFVAIGGLTLRGENSSGSAIISKANGEVTSLDVNKAETEAEENLNLNNKKVVQVSPISFRLDGKEVLGRLEGMRGTKLEIKSLFVTYSVQHLEDLLAIIADVGVETIDVIPSSVAASQIVLSDRQKIVGVALADIGHQTTSLSVFENGSLISIRVFSIGSCDITNDLALGFKIPLEEAENLKLGSGGGDYPKKKLDEIIEARLSDIFELIDEHLKKIKRSELLPAGIVFIGGGANAERLSELSKSALKLPSSLGTTEIFGNAKTKLRDSSWYGAIGAAFAGRENSGYSEGTFRNILKDVKNTIKSSIKQLMP